MLQGVFAWNSTNLKIERQLTNGENREFVDLILV